jgi:hypothetical protein
VQRHVATRLLVLESNFIRSELPKAASVEPVASTQMLPPAVSGQGCRGMG